MRNIRSILGLAAVLGALALTLTVTPAQADPTRDFADSIMRMDYHSFESFARFQHPAPFDWSTDGCSFPTPAPLQDLFRGPCTLHDFGYRNYGHGLRLGSDENTRNWIDNRFLEEMQRLCRENFARWWQEANKLTCLSQAGTVWAAVRNFGRGAFYNG
jgi:hypothetical protein